MEHFGKNKNKLKRLFEKVLSYIFPIECVSCQKEGEYICSACFAQIKLIENFSCFICNQGSFAKGICPKCEETTSIDQIIVATTYQDNIVGKLVEQFKYNYLEDTKYLLSRVLIKQIEQKELTNVLRNKVLVPVPLHKKRLAERGFNQAEELAKLLAVKFDSQVNTTIVRRVANTKQQAKLNRKQRLQNLINAFRIDSEGSWPEEVILIDDVLTTGTTFTELCKCLKKNGVKKVVCIAICHG